MPNFSEVLPPPGAEENRRLLLGLAGKPRYDFAVTYIAAAEPGTVVLGISPQSFPIPCGKILVRRW